MDVRGRDLRYFLAVAEELSFTHAAERLYLSQPALSKQIRALERHLGTLLFTRDRQQVTLTPVGEALVPHAYMRVHRAALQFRRRAGAPLRRRFTTLRTRPGR
ncbi:LysR family transcriptional regulator [Nocardia sp. NBC_00565]|uniref:LysR family transcriptional regulator n=1 Tax=Nocardia sp. NBC_00565 TaxID=2975993 RepID=UPI002E80A6C2|nr:LysR family transcriptional regulator [Nocardia sp. NBC_00565]